MELGLHQVLRTRPSTALIGRDRLDLDVVDLSAMSSQGCIHLHRVHQHLIRVRQRTFLHELVAAVVAAIHRAI